MSRTAFVLGGTGQIGAATAARLAEAGWNVIAAARRPPGSHALGSFEHRLVDRTEPGSLARALGDGVDLLVDVIRTPEPTPSSSCRRARGSARSSRSPACPSTGTQKGAPSTTAPETFPELPVPTDEDQPTVEAGESTYSRRKVAMERTLLTRLGHPSRSSVHARCTGPALPACASGTS